MYRETWTVTRICWVMLWKSYIVPNQFYPERNGWNLFYMRTTEGLMRLWWNRERAIANSHTPWNTQIRQTVDNSGWHRREEHQSAGNCKETEELLCMRRNRKEWSDYASRWPSRQGSRVLDKAGLSGRKHRDSVKPTLKVQAQFGTVPEHPWGIEDHKKAKALQDLLSKMRKSRHSRVKQHGFLAHTNAIFV